jgi:hypothetical protein
VLHRKPRYPLRDGFRLLGLPRSTGYLKIQSGQLRVQKDGRRAFITAEEIDRYVAALGTVKSTLGKRQTSTVEASV